MATTCERRNLDDHILFLDLLLNRPRRLGDEQGSQRSGVVLFGAGHLTALGRRVSPRFAKPAARQGGSPRSTELSKMSALRRAYQAGGERLPVLRPRCSSAKHAGSAASTDSRLERVLLDRRLL